MSNRLASTIVQTFSTQIVSQFIAIVSGIVIARTLGPAGKGFISYAMIAVSLVSVFCYGFADAVLYQFGKRQQPARPVRSAAMRTLTIILAVVVPLFVAVALLIPSQRPLAVAAAALPFVVYLQFMTPFLSVRENIVLVNVRAITQSFGTAALTIPLLLFTNLGLDAVVGAWFLFNVVAAVQTAWGLKPIMDSSAPPTEAQTGLMREQFRFGIRAAGASVAGFMNLRVDVFVVSLVFAPTALGWYTLAIASGEILWQVSRAFVWSALGRIGSASQAESAALVARITRNTLAIVGSLGVIAFIAGPWLIVHIYGAGFAPSASALRWALPGMVAYAAEVALTNFIVVQLARPLTLVWVQSASAITCAGLTFALAGRFGIVAAAASTSLTYLIVTAVLINIFVRNTGIGPLRLLLVQREDLHHYNDLLKGMLRILRLRSA